MIWDPQNGNLLHKLEGHNRFVTSCAFSSDNRFIATGSNDKTVIIWHISNMKDRDIIIVNDVSEKTNAFKAAALISSENSVISDWKVDDVTKWLERVELDKYSTTFKNNSIDGIELVHLTHDSLLTSLKIG
jgi:WD40 repeat protein